MSKAEHREVAKADRRTNRLLAFGVFAAPAVWFLHEIVGLAVIGRECETEEAVATWQWIVMAIVPIVAALFALGGIIGAYRVFREHNREAKITEVEGWDRVQFLSVFGAFASAFLLLNIIYFGVMPFVVEPCVRFI